MFFTSIRVLESVIATIVSNNNGYDTFLLSVKDCISDNHLEKRQPSGGARVIGLIVH